MFSVHCSYSSKLAIYILVGTQRFSAHRLVLSAMSDYFRAMFNSNVREAEAKEIAIHNVEAEIFQHLINYIYTGVYNCILIIW